ncbi:MAG: hydrolase 2, exosortase A system-associated [Gammaproteobacteria bacterium]
MNAPLLPTPHAEPFFYDADPGTRFSLYHPATPQMPARGAVLYVHPFADELNHARRMAALQSRRFAALGYAVLQQDLFGCGDSCGDFNAARWDQWKRDLRMAAAWLAERSSGPLYLWGVRLGALLAMDVARSIPVDGLILWQPFLSGRSAINQFLRQRLAADARQSHLKAARTTSALRARMTAHGSIEVAGYELALPLAQAIDACDAGSIVLPACPVHWFASGSPAPTRLAAHASRLAARWAATGTTLHFHALDGVPFWNRPDLPECPTLLDATSALFSPGGV